MSDQSNISSSETRSGYASIEPLGVSLSSLAMVDNDWQPFRFFDLPFELRSKILCVAIVTNKIQTLDPENFRAASERMNIFLASRQMYEDAYRIFYGGHTFRIFPTHGRFFGNKIVPLVARLPSHYKKTLVSLELRLGPGWNKPPTSWKVDDRLGLEEMTSVRILKLFVECDPSLETFRGFRVDKGFYTKFSEDLLERTLIRLPAVARVEVDGWSSVPRNGILMQSLVNVARRVGKTVVITNDNAAVEKERGVTRRIQGSPSIVTMSTS